MATIPIKVPPGDLPPDLADAIEALKAAGHEVQLVRDEDQELQHDPFQGVDLDTVPKAVWTAMGITREEVERHRKAPPAVEHGRTEVARPAETARRARTR